MSEFNHSRSPLATERLTANFAHADLTDFMPATSEETQVVERQAESFWLEAAMLPEGETRLDHKTTIVMEDGSIIIRTNSQAADDLLKQELSISKEGDNTTITKSWFAYVAATATHPSYVKPESISLVTGSEDDPSIPEDAPGASQADLSAISRSLDTWHNALVELKSRQESQTPQARRESAPQRWLHKLSRIIKLSQ